MTYPPPIKQTSHNTAFFVAFFNLTHTATAFSDFLFTFCALASSGYNRIKWDARGCLYPTSEQFQ